MRKQFFLFVVITAVILFYGCKKEKDSPEKIFYGKWVYGGADTIEFFNRNNINILKVKPVWAFLPAEREFEYRDGKLRLKDSVSAAAEFYTLDEFRWVERCKSFEVRRASIHAVSSDYLVTYVKLEN